MTADKLGPIQNQEQSPMEHPNFQNNGASPPKQSFSFSSDIEEARLRIQKFEAEIKNEILADLSLTQQEMLHLPEKVALYANEIFAHLIQPQVHFPHLGLSYSSLSRTQLESTPGTWRKFSSTKSTKTCASWSWTG